MENYKLERYSDLGFLCSFIKSRKTIRNLDNYIVSGVKKEFLFLNKFYHTLKIDNLKYLNLYSLLIINIVHPRLEPIKEGIYVNVLRDGVKVIIYTVSIFNFFEDEFILLNVLGKSPKTNTNINILPRDFQLFL